jgi:uncharacterized protein HemX
MQFSTQTKIGLTFGQLIAAIGLMASVGYSWQQMNVRMNSVEIQIQQMKENNNNTNSQILNFMRENREDHNKISEKMDRLYEIEFNRKNI